MFDAKLRPWIDIALNRAGARLARRGVTPDQVTLAGFGLSLAAMTAIALQAYLAGLALLLLGRLADGLDGAVARAGTPSQAGGFLDIVLDFLTYSGLVLAFALADPGANALPAAVLLFTFMGTGSSFLAFAAAAAERGLSTQAQGKKSIYYLEGIAEGAETIAFFVLACLLPGHFPHLAYAFAAVCALTTVLRVVRAYNTLRVR